MIKVNKVNHVFYFKILKGCGGTFLGGNETAWSGSGGGFSIAFSRPSYQDGVQSNAKRGVPDLAANAYPSYAVTYTSKNYRKIVGGNLALIYNN